MLAVSAGAVSQGGVTTKTAVNLRTGAGTSNSIIATLPAGTKLICGTLIGLEDSAIALDVSGEKVLVKREDASFVRLAVIF
jgi:hypothetical protein